MLSTLNEPILGATVSLDGRTTTTDPSGSFLLTGVNAGQNRPLVVDGRTASAPNRTYPVITEAANVIAGQVNVIPDIYYLPPIDVQNEVTVVPGQDTMATTLKLPGYQMMIPAGANLRNLDGTPVARMSITFLPIDRIPAPLPTNVTTAMVLTAQPGGAMSDMPMPVTYPNTLHANPGSVCNLYSFNHNSVQWVIYGTGHVSADGRTIVPDNNPATGKPYGLTDFAWHFVATQTGTCAAQSCNPTPNDPNMCPVGQTNLSPRSTQPVVYSSGAKLETMTDIAFGGARGGLELTRTYTSDLGRQNIQGRFGRGVRDNYAIQLTGTFLINGAGRVVMPEEGTGRLFSYTRSEGSTLVFTTTEAVGQLGDVLRKMSNDTFEYRKVSGEVYRFDSTGRLTAMVDRNGNTTTLSYAGNNLTQVTDPVGRSINLSYNGNGFITQATDPLNRMWTYSYDGQSRLTTVTDPIGNITEYTYWSDAEILTGENRFPLNAQCLCVLT